MTQDDDAIGARPCPVAAPLTWRSGLVGLAGVLVGAAVVGGLTPFGQRYLPHALTSFANSAGSWTALTFGLVYLSRARTWLATVLGAVSFVVMNEAYGVVANLRGTLYSAPFGGTFPVVAVVAGPVVGFAASLVRSPVALRRVVGCVVPLRTGAKASMTALGLVLTAVGATAFFVFYAYIL